MNRIAATAAVVALERLCLSRTSFPCSLFLILPLLSCPTLVRVAIESRLLFVVHFYLYTFASHFHTEGERGKERAERGTTEHKTKQQVNN